MQDPDALAAAAYGTLALIYGGFVRKTWRSGWWIHGRTAGFLIPLVGVAASTKFAGYAALSVVPANLWVWDGAPLWLTASCFVAEWGHIWAVAPGAHVWRLLGGRDRAWGWADRGIDSGRRLLGCGAVIDDNYSGRLDGRVEGRRGGVQGEPSPSLNDLGAPGGVTSRKIARLRARRARKA